MPSYRVSLDVVDVHPGHAPPEVMETAIEATRAHYRVEDNRLDLVGGVPRLSIRFSVPNGSDEEERAMGWSVVDAVAARVSEVAALSAARLTRRSATGRWYVVTRS